MVGWELREALFSSARVNAKCSWLDLHSLYMTCPALCSGDVWDTLQAGIQRSRGSADEVEYSTQWEHGCAPSEGL